MIPEPAAQAAPAAGLPAASSATPRREAAMRFILATVVLDMVAIGLIIPVLPLIIGNFTTSPNEQTFWFGVVALCYGVANFIASPILGALSDRYGRRPVLLLGMTGLALSFTVTGLASALWMVIVVRMFSGAMQANVSVAQAYVADITPAQERARRFGLLGAMFGIGFILGPVLGGLLGAIDIHLPFFVAGGLAMLNWLYGYFVLPESLPADRRQPFDWRRAHPFAALRGLARLNGVGLLIGVLALSALAQFTLHNSWVLYTTFKFGWGPAMNGWSLFTVGLMSVLMQGVLLKHLLKRFSPAQLAVSGLAASAVTYLAFGLASEGWMMFAIIIGGNLLSGGVQAALQSVISNAADPTQQGATLGAVGSLNSSMAVLAPLVSAPLLGIVSHLPRGDWRMGLPFYFCALLMALGTALAVVQFRRRQRATSATATLPGHA
ncbi:MAG: MFS transporter [Aquabacterium sp.]